MCLTDCFTHNCDYDWTSVASEPDYIHFCKTPVDTFVSTYREAIRLVRSSGRIPAVVTLPPILPERYLSFICRNGLSRDGIMRWLGSVDEISRWQATYSSLVRQLAIEERVDLIHPRWGRS